MSKLSKPSKIIGIRQTNLHFLRRKYLYSLPVYRLLSLLLFMKVIQVNCKLSKLSKLEYYYICLFSSVTTTLIFFFNASLPKNGGASYE